MIPVGGNEFVIWVLNPEDGVNIVVLHTRVFLRVYISQSVTSQNTKYNYLNVTYNFSFY